MEFVRENDQWKITYTDSTGDTKFFYHPTQVISMHTRTMIEVSEETIKSIFDSDAKTQAILNDMEPDGLRFDDTDPRPHTH